jgi:hypothetical protein
MSAYRGPATLTVAGQDTAGTANLHSTQHGLRTSWNGTFTPANGGPFNGGTGTITTSAWTSTVHVQNVRFNNGKVVADLLGEGDTPF